MMVSGRSSSNGLGTIKAKGGVREGEMKMDRDPNAGDADPDSRAIKALIKLD
jgi:hypothetical protein